MLAPGLLRGFVLPAAECLTRTHFWSLYRQSRRFDRWGGPRRERLRGQRLAEVWNAALASPLHRQRLEQAGLPASPVGPEEVWRRLAGLPPAGKQAFRQNFPAGVTTGQPTEDWRYLSTAGTTDRMTVIADFRKRDHRRSSELRVLDLALGAEVGVGTVEVPPNACNVVCGLTDSGPPSFLGYLWQALRAGQLFSREAGTELRGRFERQVLQRLHTLPPIPPLPGRRLTEVLDGYLGRIAARRPAHLRGLPVYLVWLADRCRERGLRVPGLRAVSPFGGLASPAMMARTAAGLGCPFLQKYGTSELGTVGGSCGRAPGLHVFDDLFIVEVLRHGRPVPPGEVGRLAVTDLVNVAMPLIRYDVGDVGRLHTGPCACGRTTPRLEVLGRVQEVLEVPAGALTASEVADTFFVDPAVANFRLEEVAAGSFEAAVVARPSGGPPDLAAWQDRFAALHGRPRKVRARVVPFVQPEASGKYRFVSPRPSTREVL
jgi:phenylacetate-CoA ligase